MNHEDDILTILENSLTGLTAIEISKMCEFDLSQIETALNYLVDNNYVRRFNRGKHEKQYAPIKQQSTFEQQVSAELERIKVMLIEKNKAYGDSALNPVSIFSRGDKTAGIRVRIDDKLSRLARGSEYQGDDTVLDLIGYLVLLRIAEKQQ